MSDFRLGNMATDLAEYTLDICNKNEDGTLRFPKRMYESYVKRIVDLSLDILQGVFEVNAVHALHGDCYKMVNEWDLKIEKFLNEFGYDCKFKKNKVGIYVKDN